MAKAGSPKGWPRMGDGRISTGFRRLAIVVSAPLVLLSIGLAGRECFDPTGPVSRIANEGAVAWKAAKPISDFDRYVETKLMSQQSYLNITVPEGFVFIGSPAGVQHDSSGDWTRFQLFDGRVFAVNATDRKTVSDAVIQLVWNEEATGVKRNSNEIEIAGVKLRYLGSDRFPWTEVRARDWRPALWTASFAMCVYVTIWAIGWVIAGFTARYRNPSSPT